MGNPYNSVRITFSTPDKGILVKQGLSGEWTGADFPDFYNLNPKELTSEGQEIIRIGEPGCCYYEKHTGAIMLKPKAEYKDMALTDIDGSYPEGEFWEARQIIGKPYKSVIHQFDASKTKWAIQTKESIETGQGFIFWYAKRPIQSGEVPITLLLTDGDVPGIEDVPDVSSIVGNTIKLEISVNTIMMTHSIKIRKNPEGYPAAYEQKDKLWEITPPEHFFQKEGALEWATLVMFFVEGYIIIGFNGIEETEAKKVDFYHEGEDVAKKKYAVIMPNSSRLWVYGGGTAFLGWSPLEFEEKGEIQTLYHQSVELTKNAKVQILKKTVPTGTSIEVGAKKKILEQKGKEYEKFYLWARFKGDTKRTPFLYRFRIKENVERKSAGGTTTVLEGDVLECQETIHGNMDGIFGDGNLTLRISCASKWYSDVFARKNSHIKCVFTLYGKGTTETVEGYYIDISEISRPRFGKFELSIEASPITKRLQTLPILESESYDHREFRHGDLVKELCDKAGVQLTADSYGSDPLLPVSEDARNPNWQYQRGAKYLEALNNVRQFSGRCLFSKGRRRLYYLNRPSKSDSAKYTFDMESDAFTNIKYSRADAFRTRFLVIGIDNKGQGLVAYDLDSNLENEIGESRPVVIIDPKLASLDACEKMKDALMAYYTEEQFYARFRIERYENYFDLRLFDVIQITDPKTSEVNGKYMVLAINWVINQMTCVADIEAKSLWK